MVAVPKLLAAAILAPVVTASYLPRIATSSPVSLVGVNSGRTNVVCLSDKRKGTWGLKSVRGGSNPAEREAKNLWYKYDDQLSYEPLKTKAVTAAVIGLLGSAIRQFASGVSNIQYLDGRELLVASAVGGLYVGPALHHWYNYVHDLSYKPEVSKRLPRNWGRPLFQLVLDQTVGAAIINTGYLVASLLIQNVVAGTVWPVDSLISSIYSKVRANFWPLLEANARVWPFVNIITFGFVPLRFRVLFTNAVGVAWKIYRARANRVL